jgi:hypothetical protein
MTDDRDDRLFHRAAAALRSAGPRDSDALDDVLIALSRGPRRIGARAGSMRFIAGLAAGLAFAAGLGVGLATGWRMRGESYRLAAEAVGPRPAGAPVADATYGATRQPVQFMLVAPSAARVALVGEFNDWDPSATPMARAPGGAWHVALPLANGRHVYAFVVDGSAWVADPQAPLAAERWFGSRNSVMLVDGARRQ